MKCKIVKARKQEKFDRDVWNQTTMKCYSYEKVIDATKASAAAAA